MRQAVAHVKATFGVSERRACSIIKADRKSVRYRSCRPPDTALRERLRALAVERRRFGYRRLFVLLRREGEPSGKNRIYRLYREECQSAFKFDPVSASNFDPLERLGLAVALVSSELAGIAETRRARVA